MSPSDRTKVNAIAFTGIACIMLLWGTFACVKKPTAREARFAVEIQACVAVSKSRAEYEDCRASVLTRYDIDGGAR